MPRRVAAFSCVALALVAVSHPALGWIENHVLGDEVRIEVDAAGQALVEHRIQLKTNGSQRLRTLRLRQVDPDAVPEPNSYVIPARDALSNSLESATVLHLELDHGKSTGGEQSPAELQIKVDGERGLKRGTYVFVVRYRTDLRGRNLLKRDGSLVSIEWTGPVFDDGFDNARTTFVIPTAPTPPRAAVPDEEHEADTELVPQYLSEVRRGDPVDEVELLRSYAPKEEAIVWGIRADQRAFDPLPSAAEPESAESPRGSRVADLSADPIERAWWISGAAALFLRFTLLVIIKARQVARLAGAANAEIRPWIPLPLTIRAMAVGATLVSGLGLQLLYDRPLWGAGLVLAATLLAGLGAARVAPRAVMRGPGRWLTVSESEALAPVPRPRGLWLDAGTRAGRIVLALSLVLVGGAAYLAGQREPLHAPLVALDAVVLLALFGTGRFRSLPPDPSVEPIPFFRKLLKQIRKRTAAFVRVVPRIRIPAGAVDPDELRLLLAPRLPLRGFGGIEVGMTYALGSGACLGMPEILLRVTAGSPCDQAVAGLSRRARITPGRKPEERVLTFTPRLPTVRMTAEITMALAARVSDRHSVEVPTRRASKRSKRRAA